MNETYSFGRSKRRSGPVPSQRDDQARGEPAAMPLAVAHQRPPPGRARGGDVHQFAPPATLNRRTSALRSALHQKHARSRNGCANTKNAAHIAVRGVEGPQ